MARTSNTEPKRERKPRERYRPAKCRRCRRPHGEVHVSYRGLCTDCAVAAVDANNRQMQAKSGPAWDRYVERMAQYISDSEVA